jgi:hypothetical protein
MSNSITTTNEYGNDDGFGGPLCPSPRPRQYLKWDDINGWRDRDGLPPPELLLLVAISDFLQRWIKDGDRNVPIIIENEPLPDLNELNQKIPLEDWPEGRNGQKEPPFKHYVGITLVDPATGAQYFYSNSTAGAHQLYDDMYEAVSTMRALRGTKCIPIVKPKTRPMKTRKWGMILRPHLEIVGWKTPGDGGNAIPAQPPTPRLTPPTAASSPTPTPPAPISAPAATFSSPTVQPRRAKPPVQLSEHTLSVMGDVKPLSLSEELNDEIGF